MIYVAGMLLKGICRNWQLNFEYRAASSTVAFMLLIEIINRCGRKFRDARVVLTLQLSRSIKTARASQNLRPQIPNFY